MLYWDFHGYIWNLSKKVLFTILTYNYYSIFIELINKRRKILRLLVHFKLVFQTPSDRQTRSSEPSLLYPAVQVTWILLDIPMASFSCTFSIEKPSSLGTPQSKLKYKYYHFHRILLIIFNFNINKLTNKAVYQCTFLIN